MNSHPDHVGTYRYGYIAPSWYIIYVPVSDGPVVPLCEAPDDEADAAMLVDMLNLADEGGYRGAELAERARTRAMELEAAIEEQPEDHGPET